MGISWRWCWGVWTWERGGGGEKLDGKERKGKRRNERREEERKTREGREEREEGKKVEDVDEEDEVKGGFERGSEGGRV